MARKNKALERVLVQFAYDKPEFSRSLWKIKKSVEEMTSVLDKYIQPKKPKKRH